MAREAAVLFVEDEWLIRASAVDYLRSEGCEITEAASG